MKEQTRFRKWHIVVFDELTNHETLFNTINSHKQTHYCIIGRELSPTTHKIHFHIYVEFDNACTFSSLKKIFPTAHVEDAHGTSSQNKAYITKQDSEYKEFGIPTSVKYSADDIGLNIIDYIKNNPDVELFNIALDCPEFTDYIVKNYRTLGVIRNDIRQSILPQNERNKYWDKFGNPIS